MQNFTDITGLVGVASASAASLMLLPGIVRLGKLRLGLLLGAVFVLMLNPIGGMPIAAYVRGMTGDLSITSVVMLWCVLLKPWCDCVTFEVKHRQALLVLIALAAVVLYPLALGLGAFDPYRLGYGDSFFITALLLIALAAWSQKSYPLVLCIALATLAWAVGWYESDNLWDYLLDPFVSIYALCAIAIQAAKRMMNWRHSKPHEM